MLFDQWGGTYYDAEKQLPDSTSPPGTGDDFMCWAAAASNVLAWTGWGNVNGINDIGTSLETDSIFKYFQNHWTDEGGFPMDAWTWWFDGVNPDAFNWGASQVTRNGGDFFSRLKIANYTQSQDNTALAMSAIDEFLHAGDGVTLSVYSDSGTAHAITAWGFTYDAGDPNHYTGVYVTDSDDNKDTNNARTAPDVLHYYRVQWSESDNRWYLQDYYGYNDIYIGVVDGLQKRYTGVQISKSTEIGDQNQVNPQGEVILEDNKITYSNNYGIVVGPGSRTQDDLPAQPGPTAPLREINEAQQVPGVVIENNVIAYGSLGGISISGNSADSTGTSPFARIVNNTIYGGSQTGAKKIQGLINDDAGNVFTLNLDTMVLGWVGYTSQMMTDMATSPAGVTYVTDRNNLYTLTFDPSSPPNGLIPTTLVGPCRPQTADRSGLVAWNSIVRATSSPWDKILQAPTLFSRSTRPQARPPKRSPRACMRRPAISPLTAPGIFISPVWMVLSSAPTTR